MTGRMRRTAVQAGFSAALAVAMLALILAATAAAQPVNDFVISASPSGGSAQQGGSTTSSVSTAVSGGMSQTVTLSASGLPSGVTASFSPSVVTAGQSSTMTINAAATAALGQSTITVVGTGTDVVHTTGFTLTVVPAPFPITKGQCKDGGWQNYGIFKNQGDCVSFVATGGNNPPGG